MISRTGPGADSARDQHEVRSDSTTRRRFVKHRDPDFTSRSAGRSAMISQDQLGTWICWPYTTSTGDETAAGNRQRSKAARTIPSSRRWAAPAGADRTAYMGAAAGLSGMLRK